MKFAVMLSNMFPKESCVLLATIIESLIDVISMEASAPKKSKLSALLSGGE